MTTDSIEYYHLLNVSRDASLDEIKTAFRKLAHKFHPDKNPGDKEAEEKFKTINRAYEVLADPQSRSMYDRTGSGDFNMFNGGTYAGNPSGGFGGFPGRGMGRGCGFKRGCGAGRFQNRPGYFSRNNIKINDISITAEEAKKGIEVSVTAGNNNTNKIYKIKLPNGIENGSLIRCVDEDNGNDFIIRINYRD